MSRQAPAYTWARYAWRISSCVPATHLNSTSQHRRSEKNRLELCQQAGIQLENSFDRFSHFIRADRRESDLRFVRFGDELAVFDGFLQGFLQNLRAIVRRARRKRKSFGDLARIMNAEFDQLLGLGRLREIDR